MSAAMAKAFLNWLATLVVKSGRMAWRLRDEGGNIIDLEVELGADVLLCALQTPKYGRLAISGDRLTWLPSAGPTVVQKLSDPSRFDLVRASPQLYPTHIIDALSSLSLPAQPAALDWIKGVSADVTVLEIPGISAFGLKTPELTLGGITIPAMSGDLSLRNVAIDLSGGHIGFELRVHDAQALPGSDLKIDLGSTQLSVSRTSFRLAADAVLDLASGCDTVAVDFLSFSGQTLDGSYASNTGQSAKVAAETATGQARSLVFDRGGGISGELMIACDRANATFVGLEVGPLQATRCVTDSAGFRAATRLDPGGMHSSFGLDQADIVVNAPQLNGFPSITQPTFEGGTTITARGLSLTLPQLTRGSGIVDLEGTIKPIDIDLSGLKLRLTSSARVRAEAAVNGTDLRFAALLKFATADIVVPGVPPIQLIDATAKHATFMPLGTLAASKRILRSQGLDEIALTIQFPPIQTSPPAEIALPLDALATLQDLFNLLAQQSALPGFVTGLTKQITELAEPSRALGLVPGILGIGLDGIDLLIDTMAVVVSVDGARTQDRTVTFRIKTGFEGFGINIKYHYPSPTWDDLGRQAHDTHPVRFAFSFPLPDLLAETTLFFDAAAKKIQLTGLRLYFDLGLGKIGDDAQKLFLENFGVANVINGILTVVNPRLPANLPSSWDVGSLTVDKAGGAVTGFSIALRASETDFDTI